MTCFDWKNVYGIRGFHNLDIFHVYSKNCNHVSHIDNRIEWLITNRIHVAVIRLQFWIMSTSQLLAAMGCRRKTSYFKTFQLRQIISMEVSVTIITKTLLLKLIFTTCQSSEFIGIFSFQRKLFLNGNI